MINYIRGTISLEDKLDLEEAVRKARSNNRNSARKTNKRLRFEEWFEEK